MSREMPYIKYIVRDGSTIDTIEVSSTSGIRTHLKVIGAARLDAERQAELFDLITELLNESTD